MNDRHDDREEIDQELKDLEERVKRLRVMYEQFFLGVERAEPVQPRAKLRGLLKNSALEKHRRAAVRFRFMNIVQQYTTLSNYWDRLLRLKEEGTFDFRAYRGYASRARPRPAEVPSQVPDPAPDPVPASDLYSRYLRLKEQSGGLAENLSPEQFEARLERHRETLRVRYNQDFDFDVVERDGKVTIVAKKKA